MCVATAARAVFVEPDHGSHVVATTAPDVFERVKRHRWMTFHNPSVGRSLAVLVVDARHVGDEDMGAIPVVYTSLSEARAAGGPFDRVVADAVQAKAITDAEGQRYIASL